MTNPIFDAVEIFLTSTVLLALAVGLGWAGWLAVSYLANFGRNRPRLVMTKPRVVPGREPIRPQPGLAWRHGRHDLPDREADRQDR